MMIGGMKQVIATGKDGERSMSTHIRNSPDRNGEIRWTLARVGSEINPLSP
jgi:hypothetical protein